MHHRSLAAPPTTTPKRGSHRPAKKRRRPPRLASAAQETLIYTPERRSGDPPSCRRRSGRRRLENPQIRRRPLGEPESPPDRLWSTVEEGGSRNRWGVFSSRLCWCGCWLCCCVTVKSRLVKSDRRSRWLPFRSRKERRARAHLKGNSVLRGQLLWNWNNFHLPQFARGASHLAMLSFHRLSSHLVATVCPRCINR